MDWCKNHKPIVYCWNWLIHYSSISVRNHSETNFLNSPQTSGLFVTMTYLLLSKLDQCNSRDLISLASMVYEPLYHAQEIRQLNCLLVVLAKRNEQDSKIKQHFLIVFNKTIIIIPLTLVGYEMIIANLVLRALLAIYRVISNVNSWNHCKLITKGVLKYGEVESCPDG